MTGNKHIIQNLTVALLLLFTVASAMAQGIIVNAGQSMNFEIEDVSGDSYSWEIYNDFAGINMAIVPGNCPVTDAFFVGGIDTGPSVDITFMVPGTYLVKVVAVNGCPTNNMKFYLITVLEELPIATIDEPSAICEGDEGTLVVHLTGTAPWSIILSDGVNLVTYNNIMTTPYVITVNPTLTTTYTITQVSDANGTNIEPSNTVTLIVNPRPLNSQIYQYTP